MKMLRTSGSFCPWFPNAIESAVVSNVFRLVFFFLTVGGEFAPSIVRMHLPGTPGKRLAE